jgi:hypothetical protein
MINEYETQSQLNPVLWKDDSIPEKIRLGLLKIAKRFYEFLDIDASVRDVILTGSAANYNWTPGSDIDLHVVIDYSQVNKNIDLVRNLMMAKKSIWNSTYPLRINDMDIELYAQDATEPHTSTGVYSLLSDKWVNKPTRVDIQIDDQKIAEKAKPFAYMIDNIDVNRADVLSDIDRLRDKLKKFRKCGLDTGGEYSMENLAFKWLRNNGYLARLSKLREKVMMQDMEITESKQFDVETVIRRHLYTKDKMTESEWTQLHTALDAVTDPSGQWEHPGRCTLIPSNNITMQFVDYPVFGFDETGHYILMNPDERHMYRGTQVFEIPMNRADYAEMIERIMQ